MEILNDIFPIEVINKIRLYHSHPVADMISVEVEKFQNHMINEKNKMPVCV